MAKLKKHKKKKKEPLFTVYRTAEITYTLTASGLKKLLDWPDGFVLKGIEPFCKKKEAILEGSRKTTTRDKNKTTVVTEVLERKVSEKEAREVLGISSHERIDSVDYAYGEIIVNTTEDYEGEFTG